MVEKVSAGGLIVHGWWRRAEGTWCSGEDTVRVAGRT